MLVENHTTLRIGDVLVNVSASQPERKPFKGIIRTVPGLLSSLIAFYATPDQPIAPYFIEKLARMEFIKPVNQDGGFTSYQYRAGWEITEQGSAYVRFLCGETSE